MNQINKSDERNERDARRDWSIWLVWSVRLGLECARPRTPTRDGRDRRNVRRLREAQNLPLVALAAQVKRSRPRINFFEHQKQDVPLTTVATVAKALKVPGLLRADGVVTACR